jgi:hypothetical protein
MKATALKKEPRFVLRNDKAFKVQNYGDGNDYPQQIMEIVNASGTGKSCVGVYAKFISGKGFEDIDLYKKVVNRFGQTNDYIYDQVSKDYAMFSGFSIHVNYNANFQIVELQHIPFEQVRFEMLHPETAQFNKVALHPDWGRRFLYLRRWKKEDIKFLDFFNPDPVEIQQQVDDAGGWANYKGQVLYFSNEGEKVYPLPSFDSVLTDMNTEEGISNVSNRNARNNFLTAGAFINKVSANRSASGNDYSDSEEDGERRRENGEYDRDEDNGIEKALKAFQGDENAGKMLYIEIENDEEKPEFVSFKGTNYDKEFDVTLKSSQANIGKAFNQPPILRAEDIGGNFGADVMLNAYNYYNSVTENERLNMERVFSTIFQHWFEPMGTNFSIIPLSYEVEMSLADRLGDAQLKELILLLNDKTLTIDQKKSIAKTLFGLTDDEANNLVPIPVTPPTA